MKKSLKIALAALGLAVLVPGATYAKEITSLNAALGDGYIAVAGTAEAGTLAVAVLVYDESGEELIAMETTDVTDENSYATRIAADSGTYIVKVADYEGGDYQTVTVAPASTSDDAEEETTTETTTVTPGAPNSGENGTTETVAAETATAETPSTSSPVVLAWLAGLLTTFGAFTIIRKKL